MNKRKALIIHEVRSDGDNSVHEYMHFYRGKINSNSFGVVIEMGVATNRLAVSCELHGASIIGDEKAMKAAIRRYFKDKYASGEVLISTRPVISRKRNKNTIGL